MAALLARRWPRQRTPAGGLVPAREVMGAPLRQAILAHFRQDAPLGLINAPAPTRRVLSRFDVRRKILLALDALGFQGHLSGMARRALDLLFLPTRLAVDVEERRLAAVDADYSKGLATGWALCVFFPHLRLAHGAPDVDRGFFPAEGADDVLWCDKFRTVSAGPLEAGRTMTLFPGRLDNI